VVDAAVKQDAFLFSAFSRGGDQVDWSDHRCIVMAAVKHDPRRLWQVSDALRADPDIVMTAVKRDGDMLQYASDTLKADPNIVLEAVRQNGNLIWMADNSLKESPDIVRTALSNTDDIAHVFLHAGGAALLDPVVLSIVIRSGIKFRMQDQVKEQLRVATEAIWAQHNWEGRRRPVSFQDSVGADFGSAVCSYVEHSWKAGLRQKLLLLRQKRNPPIGKDLCKLIASFSFPHEFGLADEVLRLAPIFSAFADRGINWNGIVYAFHVS
jgi:hypothetical protein